MSTHPLEYGLGASRHFNHEKALLGAFSVIVQYSRTFVLSPTADCPHLLSVWKTSAWLRRHM